MQYRRTGNWPEIEQKLAEQLDKLAYEDFAVANSAETMLKCLQSTLGDVQKALGDDGSMHPDMIPRAPPEICFVCLISIL